MTKLVGFILTVLFVGSTLNFYYSPTPVTTIFGQTNGVAHTIADGGMYISSTLYVQGKEMFLTSYERASGRVWATGYNALVAGRATQETRIAEVANEIAGLFEYLDQMLYMGVFEKFFLMCLWLIYWICQAQYLWGYVGLSVLALLARKIHHGLVAGRDTKASVC